MGILYFDQDWLSGDRVVAILKMMSVSDATYKQAANQAETRNCCNYVSNSNFSVHTRAGNEPSQSLKFSRFFHI